MCDFETAARGACGWVKGPGSPSDYAFNVVKSGQTAARENIDHTTHSPDGHVLYLPPTTSLTIKGSTAKMIGPEMENLQTQCFSFWYLRSGGCDIQLKLGYLRQPIRSTKVLWESPSTDPLEEWVKVSVTVDVTSKANFILEATKSSKHCCAFN